MEKDRGERTLHLGRFEDGALFWYRHTPDGRVTESFKERLVETKIGREYQIDGVGIYKMMAPPRFCFLKEGTRK
ncbi:MAG: hypothetical protein ONA90_07165 [candidate division KSB1 bacterium]|nr:hypothetical protein [candidate division KSB1 bacterium]